MVVLSYFQKCVLNTRKKFENHTAVYKRYDDNLAVLDWGVPGSSNYYIHYVFDHKNLFICGDLGEAVVNLTEKATLKSLARYINMPEYFAEKVSSSCSGDLYIYPPSEVELDLEAQKTELLEDCTDDEACELSELFDELQLSVDEVAGCKASEQLINSLSEYWDDIELDVHNIGKRISPRAVSWLVGLEMAYEQLGEKANE
ncbi:MAG: hypothetical protein ACI4KF_12320 [Huintestinicola sp.]